MQYFSYIAQTYARQNKLQKAILSILESNERLIMDWSTVEVWKANILDAIIDLCREHHNCKAITADWYTPSGSNDAHLFLSASICNFHLYASK